MDSNKKLVRDIKVLMADIESILDDVKDKTSNEVSEIHATLSKKLAITKGQLIKSEQDLLNREQIGAKLANEYVQGNPWKLAIIAAVLGFLIGYTM